MKKTALGSPQLLSLFALGAVFLCYAAEKALKRLFVWSETSALLQALLFTLALAAVFFALMKAKEPYLGFIAGIFAFKIMPPEIEMLSYYNMDAACVYYIVRYAALALFAYQIYKLYLSQNKKPNHIRALPVFALLAVVPFITHFSGALEEYAYMKTGSMMLPYALDAGSYIAAYAVLGALCFAYRGKNAALICDFSVLAFLLSAARKLCSVLIITNAGMHLSKSYICWIAIYAALLIIFVVIRKKTADGALILSGAAPGE